MPSKSVPISPTIALDKDAFPNRRLGRRTKSFSLPKQAKFL